MSEPSGQLEHRQSSHRDSALTQHESLAALPNSISHSDPSGIHPIVAPEKGWEAWMSVLSGFFTIMNTWGLIISFGIFQTYYVSTLGHTPADIAWIGSLAVFFLFFGGIFSGQLTDAGYFRATTSTGAFLILVGTFMTSICHAYWQLILAQGICIGLGNGCILTPVMTVMSTYFQRRLPLAMGVAACGSVTGGLIFPAMARVLLPSIGFSWTMRAIGFIQLGTLAFAMSIIRPRLAPRKAKAFIDWAEFQEPEFALYVTGSFFSFLGVFFPFFFLTSYARNIQGMQYTESLDLLLTLNGIGFIGRLLPGVVSRYLGTLNVLILFILVSSLSMLTWIAVSSTVGLYVWLSFYSIAIGGVQSLFPAAVSSISPDLRKLGSRMGIVFGAVGIGALIGSPISGALITAMNGSYTGAQIFAGCAMLLGVSLIMAARERRRFKKHEAFWTRM